MDHDIMEFLQNRDQRGIELIVERYGKLIRYIAVTILRDREGAVEECMNDVYLKLWTHGAEYDYSRASFKTYLKAITRNTALNHLRKLRRLEELEGMEETPARKLSDSLRREMGNAAVNAARAAGYYNAGTVEFLLDSTENFYFMEMNTRIQVEHPVTEMVTGIDLVKQMIRISAGEKLKYRQEDIRLQGCAIECRISAEDADHGFLPCAGRVTGLYVPGGNGVRVDSLLYNGCSIPPYYDSMLAKVIVHGETREEAIQKMRSALGEFVIEGITTNLEFQHRLIGDQRFQAGDAAAINAALEERCRKVC